MTGGGEKEKSRDLWEDVKIMIRTIQIEDEKNIGKITLNTDDPQFTIKLSSIDSQIIPYTATKLTMNFQSPNLFPNILIVVGDYLPLSAGGLLIFG